jgi:hypothetical protein
MMGRNTLIIPNFFVWLPIAGEIKPNISLVIIGIEPIIPINNETYIWAKNACPGAVWISFTSCGSNVFSIKEVTWIATLLNGSG